MTAPLHRRRVVSAAGIGGAGLLAASLSARAGSRQFYLLTAGLAATWTGGAWPPDPCPGTELQAAATARATLW